MSEETPKPEQTPAPAAESSFTKKILIFGLPAFLVQLVAIYFLTAKIVVPAAVERAVAVPAAQGTEAANQEEATQPKEDFIYVVRDLIINPAGTNGQRYLLTTIAFNVTSEEALKGIEKREMAVRDALNSVLTSKTMEQLIDVTKRDALRQEIATQVKPLVAGGKLSGVYFSKYIVQ